MPFIRLRKYPSFLSAEGFIMNGCWILSDVFSTSTEIITNISFYMYINKVNFFDLLNVKPTLYLWDEPYWLCCMYPFRILLNSINYYILRISACIINRESWLLFLCIFIMLLPGFGVRVVLALKNKLGSIYSSIFYTCLCKIAVNLLNSIFQFTYYIFHHV